MRAVVTRVLSASVEIGGKTAGAIEKGFLILLGVHEEDTEAEAKKIADKILTNISGLKFEYEGKEFSVTMTIGISEGVKDTSIDNMITRADARLYKGKNSGKNHTEYED